MFTTRPELRGTFGMVSSTHWLASATGMAMLEQGGNAFDAAVAAGFTLQVVEPHMGGPGGEVPILLHRADEGRALVICGQGVAPAAATPAAFAELGLDAVPGTGSLAACVPGAFDAWMLLLRAHGTLSIRTVMEPAIGYAQRGYPLHERARETIADVERLFRDNWTSSAETYLPHGRVPRAGELFANPRLAATYRRIVDDAEQAAATREGQIDAARDAFYRGWVAETIGDWVASTPVLDTSGRHHRGLLTANDLAAWSASTEAPVAREYAGHVVCKTGPWGQGPVMLAQLALLEGFDLAAMMPGADFAHTFIECAKLAYADRDAWYGDPDFGDVPLDDLLSPAYAEHRRTLIGAAASWQLRPGQPGGREPRLAECRDDTADVTGDPAAFGRPATGDTSHVDVVDRHGNMVSATPSGGWLQGSPVIPELGFCLGTRAQMFWLDEGLPNTLAPGKRPRTTLSPTLVLRDGEPVLAMGTEGGDMQDQWTLLVLLGHLRLGLDLQAAIDAPMLQTNHLIRSFFPRPLRLGHMEIEETAGQAVIEGLRARDHDVLVRDAWTLGRVCAVGREPSGVVKAGANPRLMQSYAAGR